MLAHALALIGICCCRNASVCSCQLEMRNCFANVSFNRTQRVRSAVRQRGQLVHFTAETELRDLRWDFQLNARNPISAAQLEMLSYSRNWFSVRILLLGFQCKNALCDLATPKFKCIRVSYTATNTMRAYFILLFVKMTNWSAFVHFTLIVI